MTSTKYTVFHRFYSICKRKKLSKRRDVYLTMRFSRKQSKTNESVYKKFIKRLILFAQNYFELKLHATNNVTSYFADRARKKQLVKGIHARVLRIISQCFMKNKHDVSQCWCEKCCSCEITSWKAERFARGNKLFVRKWFYWENLKLLKFLICFGSMAFKTSQINVLSYELCIKMRTFANQHC